MRLSTGLTVSAEFNPRRVKQGQWFSRLERHFIVAETVERWKVAKVLAEKTGRMFILENPFRTGGLLTVCSGILKTDFARVMEGHQPFSGETCESEETQDTRGNWYAD